MTQDEHLTASAGDPYHSALRREVDFHLTLLAIAGHDLRQPLQIFSNTYSWLSRRVTRASEARYIHHGELAIARLTEQLDQLVEALRLHERSPNISRQPGAARVASGQCAGTRRTLHDDRT